MASDCAAATAGVHSSTTASRRQFFANDTAEYGDAQASRRHRSLASAIRPWLSFHANRQCYERPRGAQKLRPLRTSGRLAQVSSWAIEVQKGRLPLQSDRWFLPGSGSHWWLRAPLV